MKRPALHAWALLALAVTLAAGPLFAQEPGGYQPARAALEATKRQALNELLQGQLRDAQASLEEKTRARNPSGMATYSEAVALLESALREVQGQGDFTVPTTWRRALDPMFKALQEGRKEHLDTFTKALADLDALYPVDQRAPPSAPEPTPAAPTPAAAAAATEVPGPTSVATSTVMDLRMKAPPPPSDDLEVFAQRGSATVWRAVGRWTATMQSEGLLTLPIYNQKGVSAGAYTNPGSRVVSTWQYTSLEIVPPGPYPLRLRSLADQSIVDLESWPGQGTVGQELLFRTRRGRWPVAHGFVVEAGGPALSDPAYLVQIPISTDPAGARVLVGGAEYRINGAPALTPCQISLPEGISPEIRLKLAGCKDAVASNFRISPGARINWRFDRPPAAPRVMVQVDPRQSWSPTRIVLKPDQRASFTVEGAWQIGARRENCTYQGYPVSGAFAHYYGENGIAADAQLPDLPYGALLYRIGDRGQIGVVQPGAPAQTLLGGTLCFDVNEKPGREFRGDNRGLLTLRVLVENITDP